MGTVLTVLFCGGGSDADGCITTLELAVVLRSVGLDPTLNEIRQFVLEIDGERHTGLIQFDEFVRVAQKLRARPNTDDDLQLAFDSFDKEKTGYISAAELQHVLTGVGDKMTDKEVAELYKESKVEGNLISKEEFMHMFRPL